MIVCKLQKNKAAAENLKQGSDLKDITNHPHEVLYGGVDCKRKTSAWMTFHM
jgi:hypothetical protein